MIFWSRAFVKHLKDENTWLREQMLHERSRAETAINALLQLKLQVPIALPVTLPPERLPTPEEEAARYEFEQVGRA